MLYEVKYWDCVSSVYILRDADDNDPLLIEDDPGSFDSKPWGCVNSIEAANVKEAAKVFLDYFKLLPMDKKLPRTFNGDKGLMNLRFIIKDKEVAVTFHKKDRVLRSKSASDSCITPKRVREGSNTDKLLSLSVGESCVFFPKTGGYVSLMRTLGGDKLRLGVKPVRDFSFAKVYVVYPTDEKMEIGVCVTRTK